MDRLILELKIPPEDAYYKLVHTIEEINTLIAAHWPSSSKPKRISPDLGNVCFASAQHGWSFTLKSFAHMYAARYKNSFNPDDMSVRLWGDWFFDREQKRFSKRSGNAGGAVRTFVEFVLDPIYKIYSQVIGGSPTELAQTMKKLRVPLKQKELHMDSKPLLRLSLSRFFGYPRGFVDMVLRHVPSPVDSASAIVEHSYTGLQSSSLAAGMRHCSSHGPLMMHVVKLYNTPDGSKFLSLARIYSGVIKTGQRVKVLGEAYSLDDDEDMALAEVSSIAVPVGRFSVEVNSAVAGNLVLLEGIDAPIKKTATVTDVQVADAAIFAPLSFDNYAPMKIAVEPLQPAALPKMVEAMRRISKSYPLVVTRVEESGEHVIFGTGELAMDCIMHDLRHLYSDIEIKVSDPVVAFSETVVESSAIKCFAETPNKRNKLTFLSEPLEKGLAQDIESGAVCISWDKKTISEFFRSKYDWDLLSSRSVWAFGPDDRGPNILTDDTLPSVVDRNLLSSIHSSVVQGFKWGCREGPLCDEPVRNVKFKILDATIAAEPIHRGGGQVIPTARRVAYSAFLMATPRLMEPMYRVEIQAPVDCVSAIYPVLARRRGHVVQDAPKPGAPFYTVKAFIPVMDRFASKFAIFLLTHRDGDIIFCCYCFNTATASDLKQISEPTRRVRRSVSKFSITGLWFLETLLIKMCAFNRWSLRRH